HNVELITSDFFHARKAYHDTDKEYSVGRVTFIHEPGYKKNISLKRFYSHFVMGRNLKKYLSSRKKPDVIYCAVPSLSVAYQVRNYAVKNKIRFIIDVQDLWPEAFRMVFHVPIISDIIYLPMRLMANCVYNSADDIVAVSKTYLHRAKSVNKKCGKGISCFLGTELKIFDYYALRDVARDDMKIKLVYIGTLGASYDIKTVIDALKIILDKKHTEVELEILGDGPQKEELEKYAENLPVNFYGRLEYPDMVSVLSGCDIAVNPIRHLAAQSIINKVGDYAAAGLPVINTLENKEYIHLLKKYKCGYTCKNGDANDMAAKILYLMKHPDIRKKMGHNSRRFAEKKFDREETYKSIFELICNDKKCEV
ncbi:MAG: glycosyltransferase family 4 protein, partial [Lachnospiraceae bacterium]|nr:glycosyltransferase family 4 protein [Lachnospiraceae bacterium]